MRYMIHDPALGFVVKDTGKGEQCEYKGGRNACTALKDGIGKSEYETTRREVLVHVSAVELREHVRILREALAAVLPYATSRAEDLDEEKQNGREDPKYPGADAAYQACKNAEAAIEATKEEA